MIKITAPQELQSLDNGNSFHGTLPVMKNSVITFNGSSNILFCDENVVLENSKLQFNGSNSIIFLCGSKNAYQLDVSVFNNNAFYCGSDNYFNRVVNVVLSEEKHVFIGNNCLFSLGIWIRIADPHLIYSVDTHERINPTKSVYIGDHCWIGQSAMILKGTQMHSGSILGAMSLCSGKTILSNESWGGNPAKKIAGGIFWDGACVHKWTSAETEKYHNFISDKFIFNYNKDDYLDFTLIDQRLSQAKPSSEKLEFLLSIKSDSDKNRFALN